METAKNAAKSVQSEDSQFKSGVFKSIVQRDYCSPVFSGHQVPIQHMDQPSLQSDMKGPKPVDTEIPTEDGGYQTYKAAGKLKGKKVS